MTSYVHYVNSISEIPISDCYSFYSLNGGIFYVLSQDYISFAHHWCQQKRFHPISMDLREAVSHSLLFDIDFHPAPNISFTGHGPFSEFFPYIESALKMLFLTHVHNFTYILATRAGSAGIHIHLPEFNISHDDYILLCEQLKHKFIMNIYSKGKYELDILQNMMLPGAAKPNLSAYEALQMHYIDETQNFTIYFNQKLITQLDSIKKKFKRIKANSDSFFRKILFLEELQAKQYISNLMMPIATPFQPLHKLSFATIIGTTLNGLSEYDIIATLIYRNTKNTGYIYKGKHLLFDGSHALKTFHYFKYNSFMIAEVETLNAAIKKWYKRFMIPFNGQSNPMFDAINQTIQENNSKFIENSNPIKTILEYNEGYFFLPVFYALCKHLDVSSAILGTHLKGFLSPEFLPLLNRIEQVNETLISVTVENFTEETILYCSNNLCGRFKRNRDKLKQIVEDSKRNILSVTTLNQMVSLFRRIQENYFPIQVLNIASSMKKHSSFIWNCLNETWQEIHVEREKDSHINNLWNAIVSWLREFKNLGNSGGPDDDIIKNFRLDVVTSTITSDTILERKQIQMDRHKWFIRFQDGFLDILSGYVCGTVPEMYLSDRKLSLDISRSEMIKLYLNSPELEQLYDHIMNKSFFLRYLKNLFLDKTDDLFDTVHEMIQEEMPHVAFNTNVISMLHFYTHLCKYTAFEHDLIMYLCDVLASIFISTNYERKFFVCKGDTANGKSKLFEILSKVFGSYYYCIQSDNLKPNQNSSNATPELASTLFNCRIVTSEELAGRLNENRVKQITGNSCVTFRNLYEASIGGIPTAKIFTSTNNVPDCRSTDAFKDRATAIPFQSRFVKKPPPLTSEQVRRNLFQKDESALEKSYMGCFLILLYHLKKHMNAEDGLLHYRDEPPCVVEFTQLYLLNTDVYNQFKTHMDIQIGEDYITTMSDLRSAVRQFLKNTKNMTTPETDLIVKFEDEFSKYRKSDIHVGSDKYTSFLEQKHENGLSFENDSLQGTEDSEQEVIVSKKRKSETTPLNNKKSKVETHLVYYEHVFIRNLRRYNEN